MSMFLVTSTTLFCLLIGLQLTGSSAADSHSDSSECADNVTCHHHHHHRCPCNSTGRQCVRSCDDMPDGDYQSCVCCHGNQAYVSCSGGIFYYRPCPADLVWTDDLKICNYTSRTCRECAKPGRATTVARLGTRSAATLTSLSLLVAIAISHRAD